MHVFDVLGKGRLFGKQDYMKKRKEQTLYHWGLLFLFSP
jgi:hypothetical protein